MDSFDAKTIERVLEGLKQLGRPNEYLENLAELLASEAFEKGDIESWTEIKRIQKKYSRG